MLTLCNKIEFIWQEKIWKTCFKCVSELCEYGSRMANPLNNQQVKVFYSDPHCSMYRKKYQDKDHSNPGPI